MLILWTNKSEIFFYTFYLPFGNPYGVHKYRYSVKIYIFSYSLPGGNPRGMRRNLGTFILIFYLAVPIPMEYVEIYQPFS